MRRGWIAPPGLFPLLVLLANVVIVWKLFSVEYSAYLESNEGTFIAIARQIAAHPWDLQWFPQWECGLPFQNTYLPLLQYLVGWYSRVSGHSAALSFHQISAALYCAGPVLFYFMSCSITGKSGTSFLAAMAYSVLSPCAWFVPMIRTDLGNLWNLRRLNVLGHYGEAPLTASMAVLPLAILFLYAAATRNQLRFWIFAGLAMAATILFNAFGAVVLGMVGLSLLGSGACKRPWKLLGSLLLAAGLTYALISPLVPPSVVAAIRMNSPTVDGDYRFTARSFAGVLALAAGFLFVRWATRNFRSNPLRFFLLFAFLASGVVLLGTLARVYVVPQPHRYQLAMDMACCLVLAFSLEQLFERWPRGAQAGTVLTGLLLFAAFIHNAGYARRLIRTTEPTSTSSYRVARWLDQNMSGQRVMVSGSYSFQFNDFSDTPQLFGGHDPMLPNFVMRIANFTIYSGQNAGQRDGEISTLWLKALGAHAVVVPGPQSSEAYKPFANVRKFEGLLPVLWREDDDTIYGVPAPSSSLAHVVPQDAIVRDTPIHGLDIAEVERYVQALEDVRNAPAEFRWRDRHTAEIHASVPPGQAVSVQLTYDPGWRATLDGEAIPVRRDGLGLIAMTPICRGRCDLILVFDGGLERRITQVASTLSVVIIGLVVLLAWKRNVQPTPEA